MSAATPECQQLDSQGWDHLPALYSPSACQAWAQCCPTLSGRTSAGSRDLLDQDWCAELALSLHSQAQRLDLLPADHCAVQCNFFEKHADRNWLVTLHQDLSIPVAERIADPRLSAWSVKNGQHFVHAPEELLPQLLALRLHLDPCTADDGPLRVIPASHRDGRKRSDSVQQALEQTQQCLAHTGDVLAMRPLLMHASSKSAPHSLSRRRVLHFVFGPPTLPWGMRWARAIGSDPATSAGAHQGLRSS